MMGLSQRQIGPIGLDIGSDSIKMLQLQRSGQRLSVRAAASQPYSQIQGEQLSNLIAQMLRQADFRGRRVVAALPRSIVRVKQARVPAMSAPLLRSAVELEAKAAFDLDPAQAKVQFLSAGQVRQGNDTLMEVIIVAARNRDVDQFLQQLHAAGAVVESLDFEPCAIYRSIGAAGLNAVLDIGLTQSQMIIGRDDEINFLKSIEVGGRAINEAVARKLGISVEEARALRRRLSETAPRADVAKRDPVRQAVFDATRPLVEELGQRVSLCLRYHAVSFRGKQPDKLWLIGEEAVDPQLTTYLTAALPIAVEQARPLEHIDTAAMTSIGARNSMSQWALALGLALKTSSAMLANALADPIVPNAPRVAAA